MADLYRFVGGELFSVSKNKTLVHIPELDISQIILNSSVEVLSSCKEFKTFDNHVHDYIRQKQKKLFTYQPDTLAQKAIKIIVSILNKNNLEIPIRQKDADKVRGLLNDFVSDGLMISEKKLLERLYAIVSELNITEKNSQKIEIVGFPTKNRGHLLIRCLQSYLENFDLYDRSPTIFIADDTDDLNISQQNRRDVNKICEQQKIRLLWINKKMRQNYANTISEVANVPTQITLLGDLRCENRLGASRNTLLLMSAGRISVQIDDDTICNTVLPTWARNEISITSETDCNEYRFFNSLDDALKQSKELEKDFLTIHEEVIVKHPIGLIPESPRANIDSMDKGILNSLSRHDTRISISYTGAFGDSAISRHWARLFFLKPDSFEAFIKDEQTYSQALCSRQQIRSPSRLTISNMPYYMPMNIGLDSRYFLPPFTPIQRNQDGPFSQLLHLGFKSTFRVFSSWAIVHSPENRKKTEDRAQMLSVGPYRMPDILDSIIWSTSDWPYGEDPIQNTRTLGNFLFDLSQQPINLFKSKVKLYCIQLAQKRISYIQHIINLRLDAPDYWQVDARQREFGRSSPELRVFRVAVNPAFYHFSCCLSWKIKMVSHESTTLKEN